MSTLKGDRVKRLILRLVINALALYAAAAWVPGIAVRGGWSTLAAMALIFGLVNALVRPLMVLLTCPLIILTLGFFLLIINMLMLLLASWLGGTLGVGFHIRDPVAALVGAAIISVVSWALSLVIRSE
jgi:putative membrane protein